LKAFNGQNENVEKFSSANQFKQMNRMTQVLPDNPVGPGDKWDFKMEIEHEFGAEAVLLGYKRYDNSDCAIIKLEGTLKVSQDQIDAMSNAMAENANDDEVGNEMQNIISGMEVMNGKVNGLLYWDYKNNIARFSKLVLQFDILMNNPISESEKLVIPTKETITGYTSIKE